MTFEEFFIKKKIDLKALKAADEPLFEEFRAHYFAMGEKSFDHSKKFWFNKLRKSYHLAGEETVVVKKPVQTDQVKAISLEADQVVRDAPAAKPAGFKPRFKATPAAEPSDVKEKSNSETAQVPATAGFKPRFKPGVTKTAATEVTPTEPTAHTAPAEPERSALQAAASTPQADSSSNTTEQEQTAASKPTGFKPRFKAGVTKAAGKEVTPTEPTPHTAPAEPERSAQQAAASTQQADSSSNTTEQEQTAASKPTGFKPRFKTGLSKIDKKEE